ncbi:hypothetical protein CYMTET_3509 [Cymbomonas tetramitiformis]|uniref:Uncharacterized protein n=1 Tax=Cymbomonas tetramitiformis TaxID=36881 RepID=A0AAE0H364_9CHLO|nr:hypothetical protein CYMTET_3509 [Cymbomonas tetramitiformis]
MPNFLYLRARAGLLFTTWLADLVNAVYIWWAWRLAGSFLLVKLVENLYARTFDRSERKKTKNAEQGEKPVDWENPLVVSRNTISPHVPLYSFTDAATALKFWREDSGSPSSRNALSRVMILNGEWDFKLVDSPDDIPIGFEQPKFSADFGKLKASSKCLDIPKLALLLSMPAKVAEQ